MQAVEQALAHAFYEEETARIQEYKKATEIYCQRVDHYLGWHPWSMTNVVPDWATKEAAIEIVLDSINAVKSKEEAMVTRLETSANYIPGSSAVINHLNSVREMMLHHDITREDLYTMDQAAEQAITTVQVFPKDMKNADFKAYHEGTPHRS